jgi:hypothetical protein
VPLCKLCKEDRELRESHFLPAAVYAQLRAGPEQNPNPVVVSSRTSVPTSKQIKDRVLCGECEQLFSTKGEAWVLNNMARKDGFKLQDALIASSPIPVNATFAVYSSAAVPTINMDALVYFALSVFWRGSVHRWKDGSQEIKGIELGPFEEPIRVFLRGGNFPANVVVLVSVWPTRKAFPAALTPSGGRLDHCHCFNFVIPGLEFKLLTGKRIPAELRCKCSHASDEKFIFFDKSIESYTLDVFMRLLSGAPGSHPSFGR